MLEQALPVNEAQPVCRLPIRPRPESGEAPIGYVQRVAEVNGYATSQLLWHGLKTWENLATALSMGTHGNRELVGSLPAHWRFNADLESSAWGKADFNHSHLRWCPLCLMDSSHVRGIWLLKLCCVCTEHKIVLHERCQNCGNLQDLPHLSTSGWMFVVFVGGG